eukprot:SAG31_NODE_31700_length_365_cov_0.774436_1_plen_92_part_01
MQGQRGIEKFIESHVCNDICRLLKLIPITTPSSHHHPNHLGGQNAMATDQHIIEYARYIGIDPATEAPLMWIAQEGCDAPLPKGWGEAVAAD